MTTMASYYMNIIAFFFVIQLTIDLEFLLAVAIDLFAGVRIAR